MSQALVLFAHGSRDPRWAEPFERMAQAARQRLGPQTPVTLAYLELMSPSLEDAIEDAVVAGAQRIHVAPLFLGAGGHVREDLPRLLENVQQRHPGLRVDLLPLLGDLPEIAEAVAGACARHLAAD